MKDGSKRADPLPLSRQETDRYIVLDRRCKTGQVQRGTPEHREIRSLERRFAALGMTFARRFIIDDQFRIRNAEWADRHRSTIPQNRALEAWETEE